MLKTSSDETQPLLNRKCDAEVLQTEEPAYTPLPKVQLGILCYLRLLDPLNFSQIFPYINEYLAILQVTDDPSRVGFYSGLVVSSSYFDGIRNASEQHCAGKCFRLGPSCRNLSLGFNVWYVIPASISLWT